MMQAMLVDLLPAFGNRGPGGCFHGAHFGSSFVSRFLSCRLVVLAVVGVNGDDGEAYEAGVEMACHARMSSEVVRVTSGYPLSCHTTIPLEMTCHIGISILNNEVEYPSCHSASDP